MTPISLTFYVKKCIESLNHHRTLRLTDQLDHESEE